MSILAWIVVGIVAGWLAERITGRSHGLLTNLFVGIIGAFLGGWIFHKLGWHTPFAGLAGTIFVAFIGAVVLIFLLRLIRRA